MRLIIRSLSVLTMVLACSQHAAAQGTSGMLPEPMTTYELKGYGDRLKLSVHQQQAALAMHDQYKQEFRTLRQGEIAEFLKSMRSMEGSAMPSRQVVESFMKSMEQLTGKIAAIDNRVFDQMQSILTEEQLAMMPRVRMARQRARYSGNPLMMMSGVRPVDLSEIVLEMELAAEDMLNIDPAMAQYEGRLTSSLGKLFEASTKMILNMFDAMEQMGFNEESMNDPEMAEKMGEAMQQIWQDAMAKSAEAASAVSELNQRTYKSLAPLFPADSVRTFRNRFYSRAYPQLALNAFGNAPEFFDAALKLDTLTPEQRETLTAARDQTNQQMDRLIDSTVAMIDKTSKGMTPWDYGSEEMQEMQTKLRESQQELMTLNTNAMQQITDLLGPEAMQKLALKVGTMDKASAVAQAAMEKAAAADAEAVGDEVVEEDAEQVSYGFDQFVPSPISRTDLNEYAARLQLKDEQKPVLHQLHATYMEQFKQLQETEIAALNAATQSMWRFDEAAQTSVGPTPEIVEQLHRLRQSTFAAIEALDQTFFDDLAIAVLDEQQEPLMKRVQLVRARANYNRSQNTWGSWAGGSSEWQIDLATFVTKNRALSDDDRNAIDPILLAYEKAATTAMKDRYETSLVMQRAQELWQAEWSRASAENNQMKTASRYQELVGEASKRSNEANAVLRKLNRETLDQVIAKLPADAARILRMDYNRQAYPEVYNDELAMEQRLSDALKLEDLSPEQRRRVTDLVADYRPAYATLCEQMVDITAATEPPSMSGEDTEAWKEWQERRESIASLRFDRDELCQRAIAHIRTLLSEDQIRRIGGLPEPRKRDPHEMW